MSKPDLDLTGLPSSEAGQTFYVRNPAGVVQSITRQHLHEYVIAWDDDHRGNAATVVDGVPVLRDGWSVVTEADARREAPALFSGGHR